MKNLFDFGRRQPDPIAETTRRLEHNPRDVLALLDRGRAYLAQHNGAAAQQDAERALQLALLEPKLTGETRAELLVRLYTLHSHALAGKGDWAAAGESITKALAAAPRNVEALLQR